MSLPKTDTIRMDELHYSMEWSVISILHIAKTNLEKSQGQTLCNKKVLYKNFGRPVTSYVDLENYLNKPYFEFLDSGDTVSDARCCDTCFKTASLILMSSQS